MVLERVDGYFTLKLLEKRREYNLETHLAFVNYVKAFDRLNREFNDYIEI